jgi:CRP/FNR family transcriptional regulator, cyclic AMP receptor protein
MSQLRMTVLFRVVSSARYKLLAPGVIKSQKHGVPCRKGTRINLLLTQQEIAELVGATRVMVSRALQELTANKYLERDQKYYILKDRCF